MRILIIAGEASGDAYGAALARKLREIEQEIEPAVDLDLVGLGGAAMEKADVRLVCNTADKSSVGFTEALKNVGVMRRVLLRVTRTLEDERPDCIVLIDFPGFNMRVAEIARRMDIPVIYFFAPTAWAWGRGRARKVAETVTKVASVFPFEERFYSEAGADVVFVGHPLVDMVDRDLGRDRARSELGISQEHVFVGLLPGSRKQEINALLPVMVGAAARLAGEIKPSPSVFGLALAPTISRGEVDDLLSRIPDARGIPLKIFEGAAHKCMAAADALIVASGTATLEAAMFGTPMVIVYKMSASTWILGRFLVKIPYIGLPNILAGEEIVPELLQNEATVDRISAEVLKFLEEPAYREDTSKALLDVTNKLGSPGAIERTARLILDTARRA